MSTQEQLHDAVTQLQEAQHTDSSRQQEAVTLRNSIAHSMDKVRLCCYDMNEGMDV